MTNCVTIQKLSKEKGIDESYIRKMIKDNTLTAYKIDGYKRIYVDLFEFENTMKPVNNNDTKFNLDEFLV